MTTDYQTRINKFDSFFLWVASFSGVGFSIFIAYLKLPVLPYIPIFILIAISLGIGYLNGAVFSDSFTNRIRGWNYFLTGSAIYIPLASIKFSETYMTAHYPGYSNFEPTLSATVGIIFVILYLIFTQKITPAVYASLGNQFGSVTKKILNRSTLASVILAFSLFMLIFTVELSTNLLTLAIFIIFILMFIAPIVTQEKRIKKLMPLEKYQDCVNIETLQKNFYFNVSSVLVAVLTLSLFIVSQLPHSNFQVLTLLAIVIVFIGSIIGLYLSLIHSDRGDLVTIKEAYERQLTQAEIEEMNRIVNSVNC